MRSRMRAPAELGKQIESHRSYLLRYASIHLRDPSTAEDAVQETLLAGISGAGRFEGRADLRTWLTGILKHKIVDAIRKASREVSFDALAEEDDTAIDALFDAREHLGVEMEEICRELAISRSNCGVLLYRARMALQECLNANWFAR
jgi:RNA polymerase sigma-70 factor (ECF subfamily)